MDEIFAENTGDSKSLIANLKISSSDKLYSLAILWRLVKLYFNQSRSL